MNPMRKIAYLLNDYCNYQVLGVYTKEIVRNHPKLEFSDVILKEPILLLKKDEKKIALKFYSNETSKGKLQFECRKIKYINALEFEFIKIQSKINNVKCKSSN